MANLALSPDLPVSASFDKFFADTRVSLVILFEVKASNFISEKQAQNLAELISANGTNYYLSIVFVNDSEFCAYDSETIERQMVLKNFAYCAKITRFNDEITIRWLYY